MEKRYHPGMKEVAVHRGALPTQEIRKLLRAGHVKGARKEHVRPASLDLTVSDEIYRVDRLFLPEAKETVRKLLTRVNYEPHDPNAPMECGVTYLARLNESIDLPKHVYAFCNPKSTTGRNDVHARVLVDGVSRYDDATPGGRSGEVWTIISPRSYPVRIHSGMALSQMRFLTADTRLSEDELADMMKYEGLLYDKKGKQFTYNALKAKNYDGSLALTLDLSGRIAGYECRMPNTVVDLHKKAGHDPRDFFNPIPKRNGRMILREGRFYVLSTKEYVRVPPMLACEMRPMDERYGDFRAHYAGFIDPGWGWGKRGEEKGRPLTLEVRPFENLEVRHGQVIARVKFERMSEYPEMVYDAAGSTYTAQKGPKLAKQFKTT